MEHERRKPSAFALDDPRIEVETGANDPPSQAVSEPPQTPRPGLQWGKVLLGALGGLAVLSLLMSIQNWVLALMQRQDWIGFLATVLLAVAVFAFVMVLARELLALARLSTMTALRQRGEIALHNGDVPEARAVASGIGTALSGRSELEDGLRQMKRHARDVLDARQVLILTERLLVQTLDKQARTAIGVSGRRVAAVTSISPSAIVDVAFVAFENIRLLRRLSAIYGGRPGFLATLRLFRMVAGHLAVTGSLALTDGLVQQLVGHGVAARLSRRFSEGLINGGFTIRIGLAALNVIRPLPFIEAQPPKLREFAAEFLKFGSGSGVEKSVSGK